MSIYNLPSDQMVRELINNANSPIVGFGPDNLILGKATVKKDDPEANTTLNVRGVGGADYIGQVAVTYNRLDLNVLFRGDFRPQFTALGQSNLYRLLPEINAALGLNFTSDDLLDVDLKLLDEGDQVTIELRAKPGSVAYFGTAKVLFNRSYRQLKTMVVNNVFDELEHADPVLEGYTSAGLLTWGQDFTIISHLLQVNRYGNNYKGSWMTQVGLQEALADMFGIEDWPDVETAQAAKMSVRDYATKDHPDANRNFSRVVVQTDIRNNGYSGTAFFHYNV